MSAPRTAPARPAKSGRPPGRPSKRSNMDRVNRIVPDGFSGRFTPLYDELSSAICQFADNGNATEMKLIIKVQALAAEREIGNPFGWTERVSLPAIAEAIGSSPQNLRCQAERLFGPESLIERMDANKAMEAGIIPKRRPQRDKWIFRIRVDALRDWVKRRRAAKKKAVQDAERLAELRREAEERAARAAEQETAPPETRRPLLDKPVRFGPRSKPFELPEPAREALRTCTAISSQRPGELRELSITANGLLMFDFRPGRGKSSGEEKAIIRSETEAGEVSQVSEPKGSYGQSQGRLRPITEDKGLTNITVTNNLRAALDKQFMQRCGSPIDDAILGKVITALGDLRASTLAAFRAVLELEKGKVKSWPFLVHVAGRARKVAARTGELGVDTEGESAGAAELERKRATRAARSILDDPSSSWSDREMAKEVLAAK